MLDAGGLAIMVAALDTLREDYVRTARAKGATERVVLFRHALRNALIPILTVIGLNIGTLLSGAVIAETVFSRPGIGRVALEAILARDARIRGIVRPEVVKRLVGEHLAERRDHAMRLWALLNLEWWLRSERAPTVA